MIFPRVKFSFTFPRQVGRLRSENQSIQESITRFFFFLTLHFTADIMAARTLSGGVPSGGDSKEPIAAVVDILVPPEKSKEEEKFEVPKIAPEKGLQLPWNDDPEGIQNRLGKALQTVFAISCTHQGKFSAYETFKDVSKVVDQFHLGGLTVDPKNKEILEQTQRLRKVAIPT